jgi:hypothetical protein
MVIGYLNNETRIKAKIEVSNTGFQPTAPITIQNQIREYHINSIEDLPDVDEIDVIEGATLVYNANTDTYDVKRIDVADIDGIIDGGEF